MTQDVKTIEIIKHAVMDYVALMNVLTQIHRKLALTTVTSVVSMMIILNAATMFVNLRPLFAITIEILKMNVRTEIHVLGTKRKKTAAMVFV